MGDVTILVNNAAVVHGKSLMDSDDDALLKSQHINTMGQFWVRLAETKAEAVCMQKLGEFLLADYPYHFHRLVTHDRYYGRLSGVFPNCLSAPETSEGF